MPFASSLGVHDPIRDLNLPEDIPILVYVNERQLPKRKDRDLADGDTVGGVPALPGE